MKNTKKKTILIITEFFPASEAGESRGGVEMRSWQIAKNLTSQFNIKIITSREPGTESKQVFQGMEIYRCGAERKYTQAGELFKRWQFMRQAISLGCQLQPDLIDGQSIIAYYPAFKVAKQLKKPAVMTCHDVWLGEWCKLFKATGLVGELYERKYLSWPWKVIIANSHTTKQKLLQAKVNPSIVQVVPNGIDLEFVNKVSAVKERGISICCVSRLVSYKRVNDLIRAVKILKKEHQHIKCHIVGSGPEMPRLKKLIKELGLSGNIVMHGFIKKYSDVIKIMKQSNVFCFPSAVEGFGIVLLEAMACGLPIVASDIPPLREVTKNGQGAIHYRVGNIEEMASKLHMIIRDQELVQKLTEQGSAIAREYSWKKIAEQSTSIYQDIL